MNKTFENKKISKSIIVPAKNEEGNLDELLNKPHFETDYEIIIVCGECLIIHLRKQNH